MALLQHLSTNQEINQDYYAHKLISLQTFKTFQTYPATQNLFDFLEVHRTTSATFCIPFSFGKHSCGTCHRQLLNCKHSPNILMTLSQ